MSRHLASATIYIRFAVYDPTVGHCVAEWYLCASRSDESMLYWGRRLREASDHLMHYFAASIFGNPELKHFCWVLVHHSTPEKCPKYLQNNSCCFLVGLNQLHKCKRSPLYYTSYGVPPKAFAWRKLILRCGPYLRLNGHRAWNRLPWGKVLAQQDPLVFSLSAALPDA